MDLQVACSVWGHPGGHDDGLALWTEIEGVVKDGS